MKQQTKDPSLGQELGGLADLYRTVFFMMGRRLRDGPRWEDRLREETLRSHAPKQPAEYARKASHSHS